jgi:hypothetical protein
VASYPQDLRMGVVDGLVNGRSYDDIREYLRGAGVEEADLASDDSLRTYRESLEFDMAKKQRAAAGELNFTAGSLMGCAAARVEIMQNQTLEVLKRLMDAGYLETADMFKLLGFTLQYQKQQLQARMVSVKLGDAPRPESLNIGVQPLAEMKAMLATAAERAAAKADAARAAAEAADAEAVDLAVMSGNVAKDGESLGIMADNGDEPGMIADPPMVAEDVDDVDEMDEEDVADFAMAVGAEYALSAAGATKAPPRFKNSPSPTTRAKARQRRRKKR